MSFLEDFDHLKIEMKDILSATNNFNSNRMIGSGGLGRVYKGELSLPGGRIKMVSFKILDRSLSQWNIEFWKEVMRLSKYKHENLISLIGYCIEGDKMILAYEYASRGSLDHYLSDDRLTWTQRLNICVGVARGLQYLHDPRREQQRVIHRDIKSGNILLDEYWMPKVSDFGLSKFGPAKQGHTFLESNAVGTPGYCDPLYWETGILSKESDVYSFGVVLLEILCGRLCCEYNKGKVTKVFVPKWKQCYIENTLDEIIFPRLTEQMDPGSLNAFSAIAYRCLEKDRDHRPTMAEVVEKLEFALQQQDKFEDIRKKVDFENLIKITDGMSKEVDWEVDEIIILKEDYDLSDLPDSPRCKNLLKLSIQIPGFIEIPLTFFEHMPLLKELDLSTTNIQSLPSSISSLFMLQKLFLRDCRVLMELPSEIGMLTKLKLLDCEGSGIMYIPNEIGELNDLEVLKVSLSLYADNFLKTKRVNDSVKIPKNILSKLNKLKELCLTTRPEVESWEEDVKEIQDDLCLLQHLKTLKWYLPTKMVLNQFLQIKREGKRIYENLSNFTLTIGRDPQLTSCLPANLEKKFEKFEKCLKWINAEGDEKDISKIMEHAEALFLSRHWTIVRLSVFNLTKLKYCLLSECNEMETLAEVSELSQDVENIVKVGLESIEYLTFYDMEKFQTIWKGPMGKNSLSRLRILALHRCSKLTTIFTINIAQSLSRLTELIVEDCPNVRSLISDESSNIAIGPLIPCLEKIYLLDLPELDSISIGKIILEKVDTLFVYSCSKLKYLSVMELPNIQKIKGEKEWWNDLICDKTRLQIVFEQLEEEAINLFDQLAEATNSLQHFDHILTNDAKDDKPLDRSSLVVSGTKDHTSNLSMERSSPFPVGFRFCPTDIELVMYYLKRKLLGKKIRLNGVAEVNIYDFSAWDLPGKSSLRSGNLWFFFVPKAKKYSSGSRYKRATETGYWIVTGKDREVKYKERIVATIKTLVFYQWKAGVGERTNWVMHEYKMEDEQLANAGIIQDMYVLCKVFEKSGSVPKHDAQYDTRFYEEDWNDDIVEPGSSASAVIYSENEAINTPTCKQKSLATMDMTVPITELDAKDEMPFDLCSLEVSETKGHSSNFTIGEQEGLFLSQPDAKYDRSSLEVSQTKGNTSNFPSGEQEGLSLSQPDAKDEKPLVPSSFGMSETKGQSSNFSIGESEGLSLSPPVHVMEGPISEAPAIGIDLGTTYSCVAVWNRNQIEIIPNDQGNRTTPSCVAFIDEGRLIGDGATYETAIRPGSTIFDAKRLIGRKFSDLKVQAAMKLWPFRVREGPVDTPKIVVIYKGQEKEFLAEEISSMILGKMKEIAEVYLGKDVKNAVITVPACFDDSQRQATKDAGTIAGLNIMRMINEPTAAAIAYGLDNKSNVTGKINVLVFDLGGGTFDVSLSTIEEGDIFKVKGVAGDTHLGGEDFDNRMVDHCVREFKRKYSVDLLENQRALGRLKYACEKAKRILSSTPLTSIELDGLHQGIDFSMKFTRAKFEELNMSLFNICIKTLEKCLSDAKMEKSLVDEIILVGGSTRIPKIQLMLREFFDGKELSQSLNPDEAVAYGAAVMAKKLSDIGGRSFRDFSLLDVTPLSLGIDVTGNLFSIVIPRNTPIPTKKGKNYYTTADNQTSMILQVYQGERSQSTKNNLLGEFSIYGIPIAPKGFSKIKVYFEIDVNGILTVTAKIVSSGKSEKLTITQKNGRLSKDEIEKMVKDAEEYKNEDRAYKKKVDAYNALEDYLYNMENKIKNRDIKMVNPETLKKIKNSIADTTKWLADNLDATLEELQRMKVSLELVCAPLF